MPSRKGVWLPLDCGFFEDEKVIDAGERPAHLFIAMALAAKRLGTDGVLTRSQVARLHVSGWEARLVRLMEVGLVYEMEPDRFTLASWFKHNDPVAVVEERKKKDAERKRSGRSPVGVRPESSRSPDVEKRREEKRTVETPSDGAALALRAAPTDVFAETRARLAARKAVS